MNSKSATRMAGEGWPVRQIVSGGQTGADRAALDWALRHGVPHGGWCPRGRRAHDGPLDSRYLLRETPSRAYRQRTEWNVRDSDGTIVFSLRPHLVAGSALTVAMAAQYGRPCLHVPHSGPVHDTAAAMLAFLHTHAIGVVNLAGPRAVTEPGIEAFVTAVLDAAWAQCL